MVEQKISTRHSWLAFSKSKLQLKIYNILGVCWWLIILWPTNRAATRPFSLDFWMLQTSSTLPNFRTACCHGSHDNYPSKKMNDHNIILVPDPSHTPLSRRGSLGISRGQLERNRGPKKYSRQFLMHLSQCM